MLTKTASALAIVLATASGSLAATHTPAVGSSQSIYSSTGAYVGADPDRGIRFELNRDAGHANAN
jgi:hypothetical protein